jgi:hypothetical protein
MSSKYEMVLDENNPIENNAIITFYSSTDDGAFILKEWTGISITEGLYGDKTIRNEDIAILTIPAGENTFLLDMYVTKSYHGGMYNITNTEQFGDLEITYPFEAGKSYIIEGATQATDNIFTPGPKTIRVSETADDESVLLLTEWTVYDLLEKKYE